MPRLVALALWGDEAANGHTLQANGTERTFQHRFEITRPEPTKKPNKVRKPKPKKPRVRHPRVPTRTAEERIKAQRQHDRAKNQTAERKEFRRLQAQKARRERKAAGLCKTCPNPAIPGQTRCEVCRHKHNRNR